MEPTFTHGDRVEVSDIAAPINRGDIVVFMLPGRVDRAISRIIGLPGETVEARGGLTYIDGQTLNEPYLHPGTVTDKLTSQRVPPDEYFLMGDNRSDSQDSRYFGPIHRWDILYLVTSIHRSPPTTVIPCRIAP